MNTREKGRIDWLITLTPFFLIVGLAVLLFVLPEQSNDVISKVRFFFGDTLGVYYLIIGVATLAVSLFLQNISDEIRDRPHLLKRSLALRNRDFLIRHLPLNLIRP